MEVKSTSSSRLAWGRQNHVWQLLILMMSLMAQGIFTQALAQCPPSGGLPYIGGNVFLDYGQDGIKTADVDQSIGASSHALKIDKAQ
ncbi:hypothetical protein [Persicitalea sp.]|uniref:hypothetical protein n=1 Tax=Persicitalea sp. TaxID=3100273 RepID=UPI003592F517